MGKKVFIIALFLILGLIAGYITIDFLKLDSKVNPENNLLSPIADKVEQLKDSGFKKYNTDLVDKDIINILLLGIDRRSKFETGFRTDIMILASLNKKTNKVTLISVPRDLWYGGGRINAYYMRYGFEGMQNAFEEITGMRPDRYVLTDFEDFSWIVDAMGGIPVDVEVTFTDSNYPVDATKGYQTVTFIKGPELMTGERALIFSRSRKGDNDNGDWGRMKRQHLLLKGMVDAIVQPESFICKITQDQIKDDCALKINSEVINEALSTVTTGKMDTNFKLGDLEYMWDFYKDRNLYEFKSIYMDYEYVFTPPMDQYGGAWVLAPIGGDYSKFQNDIVQAMKNEVTQQPQNDQDQISTQN